MQKLLLKLQERRARKQEAREKAEVVRKIERIKYAALLAQFDPRQEQRTCQGFTLVLRKTRKED